MRTSRSGWYPVYVIFYISFHSINAQFNNAYDGQIYDSQAAETTDEFESLDNVPEILEDDARGYEKELIPIKSPRTIKNNFASMPLEPDAEMLPAHYTGVKPPGVDHMELKYAESSILESSPQIPILIFDLPIKVGKIQQNDHSLYTSQGATEVKGENGREKVAVYEKGSQGERERENEKSEYSEAGGKKKTHAGGENIVNYSKEKLGGEEGSNYEERDHRGKAQKSIGYHNVYHKDERKKDADFYNNDHHGGHFKKHDRYDEKHTASEGTFKKGDSVDDGFVQVKDGKEGVSEKSEVNQEAKGYDGRHGYDRFFKTLQGFGKEGERSEGKKFGFADAKTR